MTLVTICFSGQPRALLTYKAEWQTYFNLIKTKYDLRVFLHSWSERGYVREGNVWGGYVEGQYESGRFTQFDELIGFLNPTAFHVCTPWDNYEKELRDIQEIYTSNQQAAPYFILSQLHSINIADGIRKAYEKPGGYSAVVIKMRMDVVPDFMTLDEIDYVAEHPTYPILFVSNPSQHPHAGGGGGCHACRSFFRGQNADPSAFLHGHAHANDICDVFAIGSPAVMDRYCGMFPDVNRIYGLVKNRFAGNIGSYHMETIGTKPTVKKIINGARDSMEEQPIFVPEKLIRMNMTDCLVVHGDSSFAVRRR